MNAFFLLLTASLAAISWWLVSIEHRDKPLQAIPKNMPDYWIEDFTASTFNTEGQLQNRLQANFLVHVKTSDHSLLEHPHLITYTAESQPWQMRATNGKLSDDNHLLLLGKSATLWREQSNSQRPVTLRTTRLHFDSRSEQFYTQDHARFESQGDTMQGTGMTGKLKPHFTFILHHSVTGLVQPNT